MKKSGKFWPRVWILAGVMGMTVPITVLASEPEFARTTEEWERLRDNTLEYGEIGDLIHEYNVTVQNNQYEYTEFIKDYGKTRDEVADSYREYSQAEDSLVLSAQSKFLSYYKSQEELGSLIHRGNQNVQEMIRNTERTEQNYQEIRDYLRTEKAGANRDKKEAKDDGDMEGYAEFSMLEEIYSSAAKSYNDMIKKLNSTSSNQNRLQLEKQLTSAAQSLMISY